MNNLFLHIVFGCISFTVSTIFYLLFSSFSTFPPLKEQMAFNILIISFSITCLMYLKNLLPFNHPVVSKLFEIFNVVIVLLVAGTVFKIFPFNWANSLAVILIGLMTYAVVMIVGYGANLFDAKKINLAIQSKKRRLSDEKNH
ncbi:hypothetical protein [Sporosarcina limicola]|uniref:DUF3021 domain-containing protein n=1 Tax=Sporosarcina limicola TaxID=34101 RepID=A0A927R684_9BACL|nr:hypothetical protein [Sporosarcina limicola]MBE1554714.1 hypothetical protein [Sporosarcina limicola]